MMYCKDLFISNRRTLFKAALLAVLLLSGACSDDKKDGDDTQLDVPPELRSVAVATEVPLEARENQSREALALWKDVKTPEAFQHLVDIAKDAPDEDIRKEAEKAILKQAANNGLSRSVGQIEAWLNKIHTLKLPREYENVLKIIDAGIPLRDRIRLLRVIYSGERDFALRLAVSLAFDTGELQELQPVIAQMVGDSSNLDGSDYSVLGLTLSNLQLSTVFAGDLVQQQDKLTDKDILWVLPILAERSDINTRMVAELALRRGILPKSHAKFLKIVAERDDLPFDVLIALVNASTGKLKVKDLASFSLWTDLESEKVLLGILSGSDAPDISLEALELLAAKSMITEPAGSIIKWVKTSHWDKRAALAHAIGVLSDADNKSDEEIDKALDDFNIADDAPSKLFAFFSNVSNSRMLVRLLEKYQNSIGLDKKIKLLSHRNKDIRIIALKSIESNNIIVFKMILDHYQSEKDPDVKAVYVQQFPELLRGR